MLEILQANLVIIFGRALDFIPYHTLNQRQLNWEVAMGIEG
jgi:ribosome modulation factor